MAACPARQYEAPGSGDVIGAADEVTRLLALGAGAAHVGQGADRNRVVMADPEGNEFDLVRTLAP